MSGSPQQNDHDESCNVSNTHARVDCNLAAASREKSISPTTERPIPLYIVAGLILVGILAGAALQNTSLSYKDLFRPGYVRSTPPGAGDSGPKPKEALAAYMARGAKIYSAKCNGCHGADAKGDGANYPSLAGSTFVTGETERFAMIVLNGIQGPTSTGKTFGIMPPQGAGMTPDDLAGLMTYVRNNFGNKSGEVVSIEMATAAFETSSKRAKAGQAVTADELAQHVKNLTGAVVDPKSLVNPLTLAPAKK